MFTSLSQFYNSKEWREFRKALIAERINKADGILYDEVSGQPLINSYDIVLHHVKPLTMQNVNDYSVSLNPQNIQIVSQQTHNEIHKRFGYCTERKVYFVYGAPCSGKSTFVEKIKGNSDMVVDIDLMWACLNGGSKYNKPNALKTNVFTVRDCVYDMIKTRAGKWERCFIISGGALKGERERLIQAFRAEPIFIDTDESTCLVRLANDNSRTEEQKKQWQIYIHDWFKIYQE